jgi:hypothetical protein
MVYFTAIWYILWPFGMFCGHLVYFEAIWYSLWLLGIYFSRFGMLHQDKSGNPGRVRWQDKCAERIRSGDRAMSALASKSETKGLVVTNRSNPSTIGLGEISVAGFYLTE